MKTAVPEESALRPLVSRAFFSDAFVAPLHDATLTPTEVFLRTLRATPGWVRLLMALRNRIARRLGLKAVGPPPGAREKSAGAYRIGDRIGIFSIVGQTQNELVMGIDDSHLDVRVSVMKALDRVKPSYVISTVVTVHNALGRAYMAPVERVHPFVVKAMMRRARV